MQQQLSKRYKINARAWYLPGYQQKQPPQFSLVCSQQLFVCSTFGRRLFVKAKD